MNHAVSSGGIAGYGEVTAFMKNQQTVTAIYKSITTAGNRTISLSGSHLIYAKRHAADKFNPM